MLLGTRVALSAAPLLRHGPPGMMAPELLDAAPHSALLLLAEGGFSSTADDLAGSLFGASLFPWLAMLYWLKHPTVKAPTGVSFGLTFLLAFVFGSIPGAIGAGVLYGVSLADADWLHGAAESLLAITNCVVVLGFREALSGASGGSKGEAAGPSTAGLRVAATSLGALAALSAVAVLVSGDAAVHTPWLGGVGNLPQGLWSSEPANALSIPTWIIHTSSLVEWLVAMGLAWRYAELVDKPEWKGITWGMLPLHTSGIVACTYHLFYNVPAISWAVALQAGMTCIGNTTLAYACLRLALASGWTWQTGREDAAKLLSSVASNLGVDIAKMVGGDAAPTNEEVPSDTVVAASLSDTPMASQPGPDASAAASALIGWEDLGDTWASDGNVAFLGKLAALSGGLAYLVKYAPALVPNSVSSAWAELPDEAISAAALAVIVVPTGLNVAKWAQRSREDAEFVGDF